MTDLLLFFSVHRMAQTRRWCRGAGSSLLTKTARVEQIVRSVSSVLSCPLTIKVGPFQLRHQGNAHICIYGCMLHKHFAVLRLYHSGGVVVGLGTAAPCVVQGLHMGRPDIRG